MLLNNVFQFNYRIENSHLTTRRSFIFLCKMRWVVCILLMWLHLNLWIELWHVHVHIQAMLAFWNRLATSRIKLRKEKELCLFTSLDAAFGLLNHFFCQFMGWKENERRKHREIRNYSNIFIAHIWYGMNVSIITRGPFTLNNVDNNLLIFMWWYVSLVHSINKHRIPSIFPFLFPLLLLLLQLKLHSRV